jgi:hypothetical protein
MCDYSLAALPNRLAVEGEVHRFCTGSKDLAPPVELEAPCQQPKPIPRNSLWTWFRRALEDSPGKPTVTAVCLPPGAQLLLKKIPEDLQRQWRVEEQESVLFVQVSAAENAYRDAVQFRQGRVVMLQSLREGMLVQVLSLGGTEVEDEQSLAARRL